jgi:prepilin-type N-terminal cleavage/methylation domain-containing protein
MTYKPLYKIVARLRKGRDAGMTLPEVLIAVTISGMIVSVMSSAIVLVLRQTDNAEGRVNNAISEQNVALWMPGDLASSDEVLLGAGDSPCFPAEPCDPAYTAGSNALLLVWYGTELRGGIAVDTVTRVSYRYGQEADGSWVVARIACTKVGAEPQECVRRVVLRDLDPPPTGEPWEPGVTVPYWALEVSLLQDPTKVDDPNAVVSDPLYKQKDGRRVTVTINGGGDKEGAGGGIEKITLSAGGTDRVPTLATDGLTDPPTFTATRSRCGGNFGLIVDTSGSIVRDANGVETAATTGNMTKVKDGIKDFVNAFAGTPVRLQVVSFSSRAYTLGADDNTWTRYFDMLNAQDVADLKSAVDPLSANGATNWEDAFYRMFYKKNGTVQDSLPSTLIFFTDGMPTYTRQQNTAPGSVAATANIADQPFATPNGSVYSQTAWNRANRIIRTFDADLERTVGVFIGNAIDAEATWQTRGAGYKLINFERGYNDVYERLVWTYFRGSRLIPQRASSGLVYERWTGGNWNSTSRSNYESNNSTPGNSDGWRVRVTSTPSSWVDTSQTNYDRSNLTTDESDGFRIVRSYTAPFTQWDASTQSAYTAGNTTADDSDGWRAVGTWTVTDKSTYNSNNTTANESDGWRTFRNYAGSSFATWEPTTEAAYLAGNGATNHNSESDGWRATKVYEQPYQYYESIVNEARKTKDILGSIVTTGAPVEAAPVGGPYTNAAVADLYVSPDFGKLSSALTSLALAECGGTITVQTRVGSSPAQDPFTYNSSTGVAQQDRQGTTSKDYKSTTFDYEIPGGGSKLVELSTADTAGLALYGEGSWACTAGGQSYAVTVTPPSGTDKWATVQVPVTANKAISCVHTVTK